MITSFYIAFILLIICACIAIALAVALRTRSRRVVQLEERAQQDQAQIQQLIAQRTEAQTITEQLKTQAIREREELDKLQGTFRTEFRNMANDILEEKSRQFKETNRESLEVLLKPFKTNISEFRERVEKIYSHENEQRGMLKNEIQNLLKLNHQITQETTNLTNALRGNSKVQGDWGEMILETILDNSNLIKGIHYTTQENLKDEHGNNLRPDVILNLPEGKRIVIDSKVSLTSFVGYVNSDDAPSRERLLKEHLSSVRKHVDELGSKRYQNLIESPDFVIMFIPNEPAFMAALQGDSTIWNDAYNKKVIISSPTNLFALLKIVDDLWKRDNQSRNAIEIADEGAKLYDKFVLFLDSLTELGKSIDQSSRNYEKALNQLKTGTGNLVSRTEKLRKLGLKASKTLPAQFSNYETEQQQER